MEVNINRMANFGGFDGVHGLEAGGAAEKAGHPAGMDHRPLTVSLHGAAPSDGIMEVPDSALRRDDGLGKLMGQAFCLPAAEMPVFE